MNEYKVILDEFGYEDQDIAIAGILSIKYGNTCDWIKDLRNSCLNIKNM